MEVSAGEAALQSRADAELNAILQGHEHGVIRYRTLWTVEQYSEEQCEFAARELLRQGRETVFIRHGAGFKEVPVHKDVMESKVLLEVVGAPEEILVVESNLLVNEGLQRMLDLLIAAGGTAYNNANAYLGVGDSTTAEAATQTELQAATNRFYKAQVATYPQRTNQTIDWRSDFTGTEANYVWNEWSVAAGATTASGAGFTTGTTNLNRKVQSLGTKASGTWTLTGSITFS